MAPPGGVYGRYPKVGDGSKVARGSHFCPWPDFWEGIGNIDASQAVATAKAGGIGIIHRNLPIDAQVTHVKLVKNVGLAGAAVGVGDMVKVSFKVPIKLTSVK